MLQTSHHAGANVVVMRPLPMTAGEGLSPAVMARYLRETKSLNARCFALEMQERTAWANEAWGEFWGDVARLV
jgi:hypothetical protein